MSAAAGDGRVDPETSLRDEVSEAISDLFNTQTLH